MHPTETLEAYIFYISLHFLHSYIYIFTSQLQQSKVDRGVQINENGIYGHF